MYTIRRWRYDYTYTEDEYHIFSKLALKDIKTFKYDSFEELYYDVWYNRIGIARINRIDPVTNKLSNGDEPEAGYYINIYDKYGCMVELKLTKYRHGYFQGISLCKDILLGRYYVLHKGKTRKMLGSPTRNYGKTLKDEPSLDARVIESMHEALEYIPNEAKRWGIKSDYYNLWGLEDRSRNRGKKPRKARVEAHRAMKKQRFIW